MPGFGRRDRQRDCFQVPHLADQNHVRVFPQRRPEGTRERLGMHFDFPLIDDALLVRVDKLNRVFYRQDMRVALAVDEVYHRSQRCRLARPGRPRHQHQPALFPRQLRQHRRQAQRSKRFDLRGDDPEDRPFAAPADKEVAAKPGQIGDFNAEVQVPLLFKAILLVARQDADQHGPQHVAGQLGVGELLHFPVQADGRRRPHGQMQVRRFARRPFFVKALQCP